MKQILLFFAIFFSVSSQSQNRNGSPGFIENRGQILDQKGRTNKAVKYLLASKGLNVQLRKNGFSYDVYEKMLFWTILQLRDRT